MPLIATFNSDQGTRLLVRTPPMKPAGVVYWYTQAANKGHGSQLFQDRDAAIKAAAGDPANLQYWKEPTK